jgi:hypothetical protein
MSIVEIFSKRQKKLRGDVPDVYSYDTIPQALRVQIIHIWRETLGDVSDYFDPHQMARDAYKIIVETLCKEYGIFTLPAKTEMVYGKQRVYQEELYKFLLDQDDSERCLDAIELSFRVIDLSTRGRNYLHRNDASERADAAIAELNARFREHGVGYQYDSGEIIRIDSELLHNDAVKPALILLRASEYEGAQAEFLTAHEHYRHGRFKETLTECLKALESVMKAICAKRKWPHDPNPTAKQLIQVLFERELVPAFWSQHFSALRATLEGGVPPARNKLGGHGQGTQVVEVPAHLVAYVLHQTASAIVFLAQAERALP